MMESGAEKVDVEAMRVRRTTEKTLTPTLSPKIGGDTEGVESTEIRILFRSYFIGNSVIIVC